jgi:hypothetical protein
VLYSDLRQLLCLLALRSRLGTQPQRDVRGLHRFPHHSHQVVPEGGLLREAEVLPREPRPEMICRTLSAVTLRSAWGYFRPCGYHPSDRLIFDVLILPT